MTVGIAYKEQKYQLELVHEINMRKLAKEVDNPDVVFNAGVVCLFRHKQSGKQVIISNSHFMWNPRFDHIKIEQAYQLLEAVELVESKSEAGKDTPLFMTGDFNSKPNSAVM